MGVRVREYTVNDFLKIVIVCSNNPHAVGDLPALPYCFSCDKSMFLGEVRLCYSEEIVLPSGERLVVEGSEVMGKLKSVSYIVKGIDCEVSPEELYAKISNFVERACRSGDPVRT